MSSEKNEKLSAEEIKDVEGGASGYDVDREIYCCGKFYTVRPDVDFTCPNCGKFYKAWK